MSEQTCVAMQQALLAGLGHLKQNNREPLIHIGCNEAGITKVSIEDVAKYEILMVQLMRQNEVEKEIVLCALLAKWPHAKGDFHDTEAEKILMLYRHCIRLCKRKQFSNLLPINRIKAAYIATQGSWSERAQKADGTERPGVIVASSAVAGPDASIEERPGVWRSSSSLAYQDAPFASEVSSEEPPDVVAISDEETRSDAPSIVHVVDDGDEDARNRAREQLLKFPSLTMCSTLTAAPMRVTAPIRATLMTSCTLCRLLRLDLTMARLRLLRQLHTTLLSQLLTLLQWILPTSPKLYRGPRAAQEDAREREEAEAWQRQAAWQGRAQWQIDNCQKASGAVGCPNDAQEKSDHATPKSRSCPGCLDEESEAEPRPSQLRAEPEQTLQEQHRTESKPSPFEIQDR